MRDEVGVVDVERVHDVGLFHHLGARARLGVEVVRQLPTLGGTATKVTLVGSALS
jgi:hypothetical protein